MHQRGELYSNGRLYKVALSGQISRNIADALDIQSLCFSFIPLTFSFVVVLDFLNEEAIDDAWLVESYLSDADFLLSSLNGRTRDFGAENIIQSTAASVAARGVLFGNAHPVSSRWHAIRRPKLWEVEQSFRRNKCQLLSQKGDLYNSLTLSDHMVMATEFRPALKWLECRGSESLHAGDTVEEDSDSTSLHENKLDMSDDEIEDW